MTTLNNALILFIVNLLSRSSLVNLDTLREYHQPISASKLTFFSVNRNLSSPNVDILQLEKKSFSHKDLGTLNRYERFCYLRDLVDYVMRYRKDNSQFVRNNWEDELIISSGIDPVTDLFDGFTIPVSTREIWPKDLKRVSHNLSTGRLSFGSSLTAHSILHAKSQPPSLFKTSFFRLIGEDYSQYRKSINVPLFDRWRLLKNNNRTPNWLNANHKFILKNLQFTPGFIPINTFYHPILSIPPGDYLMNALDKIYYLVFDWFVWELDILSSPIKKGFVFFNPQDASEYIASVKKQSPRIAERYSPLRVFPINLGLAYKWNRTASPRVQFRFIPDVKEVGDLVNRYQYHKNVTIHPSQVITKDEFKGVPIYMIEPVTIQDEGKKVKVDLSYKRTAPNKQNVMVFTSLNSLYKTWEKFSIKHSRLRLPKQPIVQVYNLEDYLLDCETLLTSQCKNFRIVPSTDSYDFMAKKGHQNKKSIISHYYNYKLMPMAKKLNLWYRYCFWSVTSSRRPDW